MIGRESESVSMTLPGSLGAKRKERVSSFTAYLSLRLKTGRCQDAKDGEVITKNSLQAYGEAEQFKAATGN